MSENRDYIPTDEFRKLETEVDRRRARLETEGRALDLEKLDSAIPKPGERLAFSVAEVMPEAMEVLARVRDKWKAYCEALKPQFGALPASKACAEHPAVSRSKLFEETCQRTKQNGDQFTPAWTPCSECQGEKARTAQRAFWRKRGVPERVLGATFDNFESDTEEKVLAKGSVGAWMKRQGVFLVLRGSVGTGKGHLAAAALKAHGNGIWIGHADMLTDLRASYVVHNTSDLLESWKECECLVLDEFGLSSGGKDEDPMLYQVLADRHDKRRQTIITTNLDRDKFRDAIGFRLLDRIGEDCEIVVANWESHRKAK